MGFWIVLHSLLWNGEISRVTDIGFPLNVLTSILHLDEEPIAKSAETKEDDITLPNLSLEDRISTPATSLSKISLNNLYNFLTDPEVVATNLFVCAGVVIILTQIIYKSSYISFPISIILNCKLSSHDTFSKFIGIWNNASVALTNIFMVRDKIR